MLPDSHHGPWNGTSNLWFAPGTEPETSVATAEVGADTFVYHWSQSGKPQRGEITLTADGATLVDSFHTSGKPMVCTGTTDGNIAVTGTYAAPPGPDWGWRTEIDTHAPETLAVRMYNVSPEGGDDLAVEMLLHR